MSGRRQTNRSMGAAQRADVVSEAGATADTVDVCVVGAGPAGLTVAAGVAEHGLRVVLLDSSPDPADNISGRRVRTCGLWRANTDRQAAR